MAETGPRVTAPPTRSTHDAGEASSAAAAPSGARQSVIMIATNAGWLTGHI